jgi:hypothetical protein
MPIPMERGECSRLKKERGATDSVYPLFSSYLGMTDFNLGTTSDFDYAPAETSYTLLHSGGIHIPSVDTRDVPGARLPLEDYQLDGGVILMYHMCNM